MNLRWKWLGKGIIILSCVVASIVAITPTHAATFASPAAPCLQPPRGIDLTTRSDAELARYGLPKRPTDKTQLANWRFLIQHSSHRLCQTHPMPTSSRVSSAPTPGLRPLYAEQENGYWAGVVAVNYGYQRVTGQWQIPATNIWNPYYDSAAWVGIGGDENDGLGSLIQAGTVSYSQNGLPWYRFWYEEVNQCHNCNVGPNYVTDSVADTKIGEYDHIQVIVDDNYSFAGAAYIYIGDSDAAYYFGQTFPYNSQTHWAQSNHSTAEWEIEYTEPNLDLSSIQGCPTGTNCVTFSNDQVVRNGTTEYVDTLPTHSIAMWTNGPKLGIEQAYPGPIHNSGSAAFFNDYLVHS